MSEYATKLVGPTEFTEGCDREPIQFLGRVQSHGLLMALDAGDLQIVRVSDNSERLIGIRPEDLLGQSAPSVFSGEFRDVIESCLHDLSAGKNNPLRLDIAVRGESVTFDGVVHRTGDCVIVELENPRTEAHARSPRGRVIDQHFEFVRGTLADVAQLSDLDEIGQQITRAVRGYTGFDRVMLYRFEEDEHGVVIGEDRPEEMEPFLGLHYPASDVPQQARKLYCRSLLRLIVDVDDPGSPVVASDDRQARVPLDLSHAVLRSVSETHIEYLRNMDVGASMSISLVQGGRLWGLIACHHRGPRFVSYERRAACEMLGAVVMGQITAAEQAIAERRRAAANADCAKIVQAAATRASISDALVEYERPFLSLVEATGAAVFIGGTTRLLGTTPELKNVTRILDEIENSVGGPISRLERVAELSADFSQFSKNCCGVLAMRFVNGDAILFFRPETVRTIKWAGNPYREVEDRPASVSESDSPLDRLSPRNSFAIFAESVRGRSVPWTEANLEVAELLKSSIESLLGRRADEVSQLQRRLVSTNDEITQLIAAVSHDLKGPLVTCRGFIGLMADDLESGKMDDVRDSATRIDQAAAQMNRAIDDLLSFSRLEQVARSRSRVEGDQIRRYVLDRYESQCRDKGVNLEVDELSSAWADFDGLCRVLDNLIGNALKYGCGSEAPKVTVGGSSEADESRYFVSDNGAGIAERDHDRVFQFFQRGHSDGEGSGIGLASVRKIMQHHGGRAWVESAPGEGATFHFAFPESEIKK
ncbi:ATP-binding protein [Stratiformator vulcanicus]|uniref:histidine kinase n=1 Tax=Stratiformator vulcanicus TaxID=2527980 RepID=A0A517R7H6_9PLAN|nr:ATP-binding protein [Stratiformator vulcanicus]QDT39783.1 Phytochrome-like protein cph1 [Stratiformator vulcanicus]